MPRRGYRKGISDQKQPLPRQIYTRTTSSLHDLLQFEARSRGIPVSTLARKVLEAHASRQRVALPHARGLSDAAIRHLARIGNNLNQLARQANIGLVGISAQEIRASIDAINAFVRSI